MSSLAIRSVHLRVSDLARSLDFYTRGLGFVVASQAPAHAEFAVTADSPAILALSEDRTAPAPAPHTAGLFHAALLLPSRAALGRWLRRAADGSVEFDGFSDHGVSEAIYLHDPDGHGLEVYADRAPADWPTQNSEVVMFTHALDLPNLLAAGATASGSAPLAGAHWGHLHLRVTNPDRSVSYYHDLLGTDLRQRFGPSARFIARDGYHHHFGLNNWGGISAPQPPQALGLIDATVAIKNITTPKTTRDPDGITLNLVPLSE